MSSWKAAQAAFLGDLLQKIARLGVHRMRPFVPRRFLRNGHLQTSSATFCRALIRCPSPESLLIEVETATSACGASFVLCHCHWQPAQVRSERLTMVLAHGLEGSSSSHSPSIYHADEGDSQTPLHQNQP